jgi:hypothetical protein
MRAEVGHLAAPAQGVALHDDEGREVVSPAGEERVPHVGHGPLDPGLVPGLEDPGWVHEHLVVRGELPEGLVHDRVVEVGLHHAGLQVVRHHPLGCSAEELEGGDMALHPGQRTHQLFHDGPQLLRPVDPDRRGQPGNGKSRGRRWEPIEAEKIGHRPALDEGKIPEGQGGGCRAVLVAPGQLVHQGSQLGAAEPICRDRAGALVGGPRAGTVADRFPIGHRILCAIGSTDQWTAAGRPT